VLKQQLRPLMAGDAEVQARAEVNTARSYAGRERSGTIAEEVEAGHVRSRSKKGEGQGAAVSEQRRWRPRPWRRVLV
jgi:hypothetical protein